MSPDRKVMNFLNSRTWLTQVYKGKLGRFHQKKLNGATDIALDFKSNFTMTMGSSPVSTKNIFWAVIVHYSQSFDLFYNSKIVLRAFR